MITKNEQRATTISNELSMVLGQLMMNGFGTGSLMKEIIDSICFGNDWYGVTFDFDQYVSIQREVDRVWKDRSEWNRRSILSTAGMGGFSSDTTWAFAHLLMQNSKLLFPRLEDGAMPPSELREGEDVETAQSVLSAHLPYKSQRRVSWFRYLTSALSIRLLLEIDVLLWLFEFPAIPAYPF